MATSVRAAWGTAAADGDASPVRRVAPRGPLALTAALYLAAALAVHHRLLAQLTTAGGLDVSGSTSSSGGSLAAVVARTWRRPALHPFCAPLGVNGMGTPCPCWRSSRRSRSRGTRRDYNVAMILGPVVSGLALALALGV